MLPNPTAILDGIDPSPRALAVLVLASVLSSAVPAGVLAVHDAGDVVPGVDGPSETRCLQTKAAHLAGEPEKSFSELAYGGNPMQPGGCPRWNHTGPSSRTSALAKLPDRSAVLVAHAADTTVNVTRIGERDGETAWSTELSTNVEAQQVDVLAHPETSRAFVAWGLASWTRDDDHEEPPGGLAALDLDDGTIAWTRDEGTPGIALGPDDETVYYGYTDPGFLGHDEDGRWVNDSAELNVTAVHASNGTTRWTNATSLWWIQHAFRALHNEDAAACSGGPARLASARNVTYAVRTSRCGNVPPAVVGFSQDGELAFSSTVAPGWEAMQRDASGSWWLADVALDPSGHALYATGRHWSQGTSGSHIRDHVFALHLSSGDTMWSWESDHVVGWPSRAVWWADEGLSSVSANRYGDVVVAGFSDHGFSDRPDEDASEPRAVVLDADSGEPIGENRQVLTTGPWDHPQPRMAGDPVAAEVEMDPSGTFTYIAYRTEGESRVLGFSLAGDRGGPRWDATPARGDRAAWAEDLVVTDDTVVAAGQREGSGDVTAFERGVAHSLAAQHREARLSGHAQAGDPAVHQARRGKTGALHGHPVVEGTPTIRVEARPNVTVKVNVTEPGPYYVLVDGVEPWVNYTFQGLPVGVDGCRYGHLLSCPDASLPVDGCPDGPFSWLPRLPCRQERHGVCPGYYLQVGMHPTWRDTCWDTSRDGPVTFARADEKAKRDGEDDGAVLFGPVVLTEGRYGVYEAGEQPLQLGWAAAMSGRDCLAGATKGVDLEAPSRSRPAPELVACIEVEVGTSQAQRPGSGAVPGMQKSHSEERECDEGVDGYLNEHSFAVGPDRNVTGETFGTILHHYTVVLPYAVQTERTRWGCTPQVLSYQIGSMETVIQGRTTFKTAEEWTVLVGVEGDCERFPCWSGRSWESTNLARPTVYIPDRIVTGKKSDTASLQTEEIHHPGHTEADEEISDVISDLIMDAADLLAPAPIGTVLGYVVEAGEVWRALHPVSEDPYDAEAYPNWDCGLGCREWSAIVGPEGTVFHHRPSLRPADCEKDVQMPVKAKIQKIHYTLRGREATLGGHWIHSGQGFHVQVPIKLSPSWCS